MPFTVRGSAFMFYRLDVEAELHHVTVLYDANPSRPSQRKPYQMPVTSPRIIPHPFRS